MHHVALNGPRAHDGDLDDQIVEASGLQARQHRHLRPALDLEYAHGIGAAEHLVHLGVLGRDGGEGQRLAIVQVDEIDRLADAGQHAKRQDIDLEHAERIDVVLVPLDVGAVLHGSIEHRHGLIEPLSRQHEPAYVLGEMAWEAEQLIGDRDGLTQRGIGRIEPGFADMRLRDVAVAHPPDQTGEPGRHVLLEAHRLADLADSHARAVVNDGRADGGSFARVALVEILDDLLAPLMLEIDVDVGRLAPLGRDETLEQHIDAGGINGGDAKAIAHRAVGGRAAPLAQDGVLLGEAHHIVHGEEIARIVELRRSGPAP